MREGMELENILDKSTILATETDVQLPNRLSGTRGKDLTFAGNINLEKNHALELGKGIDKGRNAGKMLYSKDKVEIFGAGNENTPYKMKLWDNVEVGGLLQVNDGVQFGKNGQGNIHHDKDNKTLNLKGYGEEGARKVRIWDDVEVGQLFSKNGIEVRGPIRAYSDLEISGNLNANGKIQANNGMSVLGDVDIVGNITNVSLTNRLEELERTMTMNGNVPSADNVLVSNLQKEVAALTQIVNSDIDNISSRLTDITKKVNTVAAPAATNTQVNGPVPASQGNFMNEANFDNFNKDIDRRIAVARDSVYEQLKTTIGNSPSTLISDAGLKTTLADYDNRLTNMTNKMGEFKNSVNNLMPLSGLTTEQVYNLKPLFNKNFRPEFLELGNNPNLSFDLLRDAIDVTNKDDNIYYIPNIHTTGVDALDLATGFREPVTQFMNFSNKWLSGTKKLPVAGGNGLTQNLEDMDRIRQIENTAEMLKLIGADFNKDNVNRVINADRELAATNLRNFSTMTNDAIDNLSTSAVKKNAKGDVDIPGQLNIGTNGLGKYIWKLLAGAGEALEINKKDTTATTA